MENRTILLDPYMRLSAHFRLAEFLKLEGHPDNIPELCHVRNLHYGCLVVLEPVRISLGCRIIVNSGFRNPEYNKSVGGVDNSQHLIGCAADITLRPDELSEFDRLVDLVRKVPFDQLITAKSRWLHVSWTPFGKPRGQFIRDYYK